MRQTLFGANGDNGFGLWIELNFVAFFVPVGNRTAQAWNTTRSGVPMGVATLHSLHQFFHDMWRC